jgi:hypothetical protein
MKAMAPIPDKLKKTKPVTSSQSCPSTLPMWDEVARHERLSAPKPRLRPACWAAIRAIIPSLRALASTLAIAVDFINLRRYNSPDAMRKVTNLCDG